MVEELDKSENWTFTFMGANIDTITSAKNIGINTNNVNFASTSRGITMVYDTLSESMESRAVNMNSRTYSKFDFIQGELKNESSIDVDISDTTNTK